MSSGYDDMANAPKKAPLKAPRRRPALTTTERGYGHVIEWNTGVYEEVEFMKKTDSGAIVRTVQGRCNEIPVEYLYSSEMEILLMLKHQSDKRELKLNLGLKKAKRTKDKREKNLQKVRRRLEHLGKNPGMSHLEYESLKRHEVGAERKLEIARQNIEHLEKAIARCNVVSEKIENYFKTSDSKHGKRTEESPTESGASTSPSSHHHGARIRSRS